MSFSIHRKLLRRKLVEWLIGLLPNKAKRMVFVVSLARIIRGNDNISDHTLHQLNELMRLGYSDSSLRLPVYLSKVIWEDLSTELYCEGPLQCSKRVITRPELETIINDLRSKTRSWQYYGREDQMIEDVRKLVENRRLVLSDT